MGSGVGPAYMMYALLRWVYGLYPLALLAGG